MIYNVFPVKAMEGLLEKFEETYSRLLLVSFRIIKPKFTKSHDSKKLGEDNFSRDVLVVHGGPFLNFVKDYYISDFNKQFVKYLRSSCASVTQKYLDSNLIRKVRRAHSTASKHSLYFIHVSVCLPACPPSSLTWPIKSTQKHVL